MVARVNLCIFSFTTEMLAIVGLCWLLFSRIVAADDIARARIVTIGPGSDGAANLAGDGPWKSWAPLPSGRDRLCAVSMGGNVFAMGGQGYNAQGDATKVLSSVCVLNTTANATPPSAGWDCGAIGKGKSDGMISPRMLFGVKLMRMGGGSSI